MIILGGRRPAANPAAITTSLSRLVLTLFCYLALGCRLHNSLKHHLVLTNDHRYQISVSSFGYNLDGRLEVIVQNLTLSPDPSEGSNAPYFGFTLFKSNHVRIDESIPFRPFQQSLCLLEDPRNQLKFDLLSLIILPNEEKVLIRCTGTNTEFPPFKPLNYDPSRMESSPHTSYIHKYNKRAVLTNDTSSDQASVFADVIQPEQRNRSDLNLSPLYHQCEGSADHIPLNVTQDDFTRRVYSFRFYMFVSDKKQEGNYYLSFHNCRGFRGSHYNDYRRQSRNHEFGYDELSGGSHTLTRFNLSMLIYETNSPQNYLSAGAMPLPQTYLMLSVMFFLSGCVWVKFIQSQKENTLKIHNLMTVLVFAKACSLLFHGINYHYISIYGQPVVTWAYLYYATRSVKGALFFITLALIASGWSFIKHILSPRDKNIIIIIVALQMIAHVAEIMLDESTQGEVSIEFWANLCGLVDMFSCFAIMVLISWSVRHLEEASGTDGKAAMNLRKMELFKNFYVVSTIYIYLTRIATFVLLEMLVFKYTWLAQFFFELSTLVYFVVTGYYFQPMPTNSYLLLSTDNDQDEDILFSVDEHGMSDMRNRSTQDGCVSSLDENGEKTKVTRRVVEEFV